MGPAAQERGKNEKVSLLTFSCQILFSRTPENSLELFLLSFSFLVSLVFPDLFSADRFTSETRMSLALSKG